MRIRQNILRAQTDNQRGIALLRHGLMPAFGQRKPQRAAGDAGLAVAHGALTGQEIHRRGADKAGDEGIAGLVVNGQRRPLLDDLPVAHHHNLIGQSHRLHLVMGDIDHGGIDALVKGFDLRAQLHPQLGVKVRQRLIEQENLGVLTMARPIATRWRWPPESARG